MPAPLFVGAGMLLARYAPAAVKVLAGYQGAQAVSDAYAAWRARRTIGAAGAAGAYDPRYGPDRRSWAQRAEGVLGAVGKTAVFLGLGAGVAAAAYLSMRRKGRRRWGR